MHAVLATKYDSITVTLRTVHEVPDARHGLKS